MTGSRGLAVVAFLLLPATALAHSPIKGLDNFYAGLLHPLFVPAHLLAALVLGIWIGQQHPLGLQRAVLTYLCSLLLGLLATWWLPGLGVEAGMLGVVVVIGALVALARPLPPPVYLLLAGLLGLLLGLDSAQDQLSGRGRLAALLGTLIAAYLLVLYAMVIAEFFTRRHWQRVGVRIVGSWIAASALLVLTLAFAT